MADPDVFDRLFIHYVRHPSFRDALKQSDPIMWRRLKDATMHRFEERTRQ